LRVKLDDLNDVLTPGDLMAILPVGRDAIYAALHSQAIKNVRMGQKFVITKIALRDFLGGVERSPVLGRAVLHDRETENGQ
jgi:hypothetical protein